MKILAYSCRADEAEYFRKFADKYRAEIAMCREAPTLDTAGLAQGCRAVSVVTTAVGAELLRKFQALGVEYISTRTAGYDHIDVKTARELGIGVGNVAYSPASVADYTVMLMLMAVRRVRVILERAGVQDYSLNGVRGRELGGMTVGVVGTGRIGRTVIRRLSGFGSRVLAYDPHEDEEVRRFAEYVPLGELFAQSDVITLHVPATEQNRYLIGRDSLARMKDGVILINTARGSLIDTEALVGGIERGKVGGAALDVVENESGIYYRDWKGEPIGNRGLALLRSFPNVIITPHTAFYTDQAVSDMVEQSIKNCVSYLNEREGS